MVLKPVRGVPFVICQGKAVIHLTSHALSLCHQLVYGLNQQLDMGSEVWSDAHRGLIWLWFARYHALKTFYHLLSFTSSTGDLLYGVAPLFSLNVQTHS